MLGVDGLTQERWRQAAQTESARERRQRVLADNLRNSTITVEPDAGYDITNLLTQMGKPMASEEVQRRLKLCNQRFIFERSIQYPNLIGIYLSTMELTAAGTWEHKKKHVCGMEAGIMPEFTVVHTRDKRVAVNDGDHRMKWENVKEYNGETRGWRTVLVRLLHAGLITEYDVRKHFGWSPSRSSKRWHDHTT